MADNKKLDSIIQIDGTEYEVVAKTAEKVAVPLTIKVVNGTTEVYTYDGSEDPSIEIKAVQEAGHLTNGLMVYEGKDATTPSFTFDGSTAGQSIKLLTPSDITYSNSTPTVNALGGVAAGTTFDKMQITDVLDKILYPYVAPVIGTTTSYGQENNSGSEKTLNGGVFENGSTQTITSVTSYVTKKSASISTIELLQGNTVLKTHSALPNGGNISFTGLYVTINKDTANKNLTVKVTDSENKSVTKSTGTFSFVYPYYYGAIGANTTISEAVVEGLTKKVESKGSKAWTFDLTNQKAVFAYPKAYGELKSIIDANNFTVTDTFMRLELSITGLDETAQDYYVYISNSASTLSSFKYTFNI